MSISQEMPEPPEDGRGKGFSPRAFRGTVALPLISDFWFPELGENKFVLSHQVCSICCSNPRK